jgi:hypothetical protein
MLMLHDKNSFEINEEISDDPTIFPLNAPDKFLSPFAFRPPL